jgi:hypothetical protein
MHIKNMCVMLGPKEGHSGLIICMALLVKSFGLFVGFEKRRRAPEARRSSPGSGRA